jgi:riboflavin synthase
MFTGIIQALGHLETIDRYRLRVHYAAETAPLILGDIDIGDSIAVDGVCLTVETIDPQGFSVSASPETLNRTILADKLNGPMVNLESSLRVGGKIGGHFVTGHIDGLGHLLSAEETATSWWLRFTIHSPDLWPLILPKGSIAINGISLTIADCDPQGRWLAAAVIPHTYRTTNLSHLTPNSPVNLEADILGKYVQRLLKISHSNETQGRDPIHPDQDSISLDFLAEQGYL